MLTHTMIEVPLGEIHVRRGERQRREINTSDIILSIKLRGVLQPIIVEPSTEFGTRYVLIAGERRLQASKELGFPTIPARLAASLTEQERQIIELEENIKRKDLPWAEEVCAHLKIHTLYKEIDKDWTQVKTAEAIGITPQHLSNCLQVAEALNSGDKHVTAATGLRAALLVVSRKTARDVDNVMNDLLSETVPSVLAEPTIEGQTPTILPDPTIPIPAEESILNEDFIKFTESYTGVPFNLLHCDFPYGIGHDKSDQGGSTTTWENYDDSPETYWKLCGQLANNIDRILSPSAHIIFWLSSDIIRQYETLEFFAQTMPSVEFQTVPLYWHKTDNRGILPDPNRGPRRIVETALFGARGDRLIVKAVSNAYPSPTTKEIHQSEKPEPMLKHFFQMVVDENTRMLDPTCGSGTALRAAESLGAKHVLGLEINPTFVEGARSLLRKARTLRAFERKNANG